MMRDYEKIVMEHYDQVAHEDGDSALSTMKDKYVREQETRAIKSAIAVYSSESNKKSVSIIDVGCGNGYTLSEIRNNSNEVILEGLEKNDSLREIAKKRLEGIATVRGGDILNPMAETIGKKDVVISQRVIINLLDKDDQRKAIRNICELVSVGGIFIMMECFEEALRNLNEARTEFGFANIKPSFHNMYLTEDMLPNEKDGFVRYKSDGIAEENFLSSHYYVGRVLHDIVLQGRPFERNSHFLNFMTKCIPEGVGDYSPIRFYVFKRIK